MGYLITYKPPGAKKIFTLASRDYVRDCFMQVRQIIRSEAPNDLVMAVDGGPKAWNMMGEITDSLKQKLLALPFVAKIETDEEVYARRAGAMSATDRILGLMRKAIY